MRSSFSISVLYHAYVYLEFLILACTIYILAPTYLAHNMKGSTKCAQITFTEKESVRSALATEGSQQIGLEVC